MGTPELSQKRNIASSGTSKKTKAIKAAKVSIQTTDDILVALKQPIVRLQGFAINLCKNNPDDAQELYQATIVRIFENKEKFIPGTDFKARTSTIMRNLFINEYRKKVKRPTTTLDNAGYLPTETQDAPSTIYIQQLNTYIKALDPSVRIPFELHNQGFKYQEIADKLDLPIGTVKSRIFFARKKLKERILRDDPELAAVYTTKNTPEDDETNE